MNDSIVFYRSFYDAVRDMPPTEYKECMDALLEYGFDGIVPQSLSPSAYVFFTLIKPQLDANIKRREDGKKGGKYGKLGGRPKKENPIGVISKNPIGVMSETPNVNVNVNVNDNNIPPISPKGESPETVINKSELSDSVKSMLKDWIQYKRERREGYKPAGLKSLVTTATRYEKNVGADAVCEVIRKSMSSGYKGIVWDRLDNRAPVKENKFNNYSQNDYDFDALEKELIKN